MDQDGVISGPLAFVISAFDLDRQRAAIIVVVWATLAVAHGVFFSFSIFFVALVEEFGWSRALTAGAFSLSTVLQGVLGPLVGALVDRIGPRRVILGGILCLGASSILASSISAPWHLYLWTGGLGALGLVGLGWVPMGVLLSRWFKERRGRMVGLAFSGMGAGIFVTGPLAQWLIAYGGWRFASAMLGIGALLVLLPIVWLGARDAPPVRGVPAARGEPVPARRSEGRGDAPGEWGIEQRGVTPAFGAPRDATLSDALRMPAFWALFCAYLLTPLAVFPVVTHQVAFAVDLGFPRLLVASIFGFTGLMSSVGRVAFGFITDRIGGPMAATISFGCTAGGALTLVLLEALPFEASRGGASRGGAWLVLYAVLFGLGFGARGPIITAMASDLFAGRRFGVIYGVLTIGNGVGGAVGPWFGGFVHDATGSYRIAFLACVVFCALGSFCFWLAVRRRALTPREANAN